MKNFSVKLTLLLVLFISGCSTDELSEEITKEQSITSLEKVYQELLVSSSNTSNGTVMKRNPKKLYVHYMPWFHSKDVDGFWGQHWTMTNKNRRSNGREWE